MPVLTPISKISDCLSSTKDSIPLQVEDVYTLLYENCSKIYIGEIKGTICTHLKKHECDTYLRYINSSALAKYHFKQPIKVLKMASCY